MALHVFVIASCVALGKQQSEQPADTDTDMVLDPPLNQTSTEEDGEAFKPTPVNSIVYCLLLAMQVPCHVLCPRGLTCSLLTAAATGLYICRVLQRAAFYERSP